MINILLDDHEKLRERREWESGRGGGWGRCVGDRAMRIRPCYTAQFSQQLVSQCLKLQRCKLPRLSVTGWAGGE